MENQRNLILAIALSVGILLAFQFLFEQKRPPAPPQPPAPQSQTGQTGEAPRPAEAPGVAAPGATAPSTAAPAVAAPAREPALGASPRFKINTPRLHGSIALVGGRIDDLTLARYHETPDPASPEIV